MGAYTSDMGATIVDNMATLSTSSSSSLIVAELQTITGVTGLSLTATYPNVAVTCFGYCYDQQQSTSSSSSSGWKGAVVLLFLGCLCLCVCGIGCYFGSRNFYEEPSKAR